MIANGGSLSNISPGIDYFAALKKAGNFIPVQTTPQTVASGQTPISIDWDYNNLAYGPEFPSANWKVNLPADGIYGGYYCQAVNATAPSRVRALTLCDVGTSKGTGLRVAVKTARRE